MSRHIRRKQQLARSVSLGTAEAFHVSSLVNSKETERRHGLDGSINMNHFPALPLSPTEPRNSPTFPRINLAGSWLDLESDNEDENGNAAASATRMRRRKRSTSPTRDALSSLKDKLLSRRSSMHFRKLGSSRSGSVSP
ncbi:hypothetical protein EV179_003680 [Coemansia sp. RSA 487]|nr:hypothetical protein EV179_003680 [Coemansia sp. RSA 487]